MKTSALGTLNLKDVLKGLLMSVLGAIATAGYQIFTDGTFDTIFTQETEKEIIKVALIAGATYLAKNLGTPAYNKTRVLKK